MYLSSRGDSEEDKVEEILNYARGKRMRRISYDKYSGIKISVMPESTRCCVFLFFIIKKKYRRLKFVNKDEEPETRHSEYSLELTHAATTHTMRWKESTLRKRCS